MPEPSVLGVFGAVILARLLLPLLIPKYPLPAILLCLLVDGVDQTIFQTFTSVPLDGYQSFDKALDIYYLVIAYLSTLRNWRNSHAFGISRFLLYYRLVGVALFELSHWRPLLLIFPNTFEYFFIYYEVVRSRWHASQLSRRTLLLVAGGIWVFIKLPQEWWIHVAQLDVTDLVKTKLFGAAADASWSQAVAAAPLVLAALLAAVLLLALAVWRLVIPRLPRPEHRLRLSAGPPPAAADTAEERRMIFAYTRRPLDRIALEKVVLVTLVTLIFAQILPDLQSDNLRLALGVTVIALINSVASYGLAHRGYGWQNALMHFIVLGAVNAGVAAVAYLFFGLGQPINLADALFLLLLLTLLVTLHDYYQPMHAVRFDAEAQAASAMVGDEGGLRIED